MKILNSKKIRIIVFSMIGNIAIISIIVYIYILAVIGPKIRLGSTEKEVIHSLGKPTHEIKDYNRLIDIAEKGKYKFWVYNTESENESIYVILKKF